MKIVWNKVTWYSKLAAVILFFIVLLVGVYIGYEFGKLDGSTQIQSLTKACPDEWYENRMPSVGGSTGPSQYLVFKGERKELVDYDME